ncbi:MAG: FGGY family carbohydrate kinase [bacterium]
MPRTRLGIDFGTSQIKAIRVSTSGQTKSIETIPMPTKTEESRITHPPETLLKRIKDIPDRFDLTGPWDAAIASQRSTFILWHAERGNILTPLISWRDRRGAQWIQNLSSDQFDKIQDVTGLRPEAGYPLSKLRWILEDNEKIRNWAEDGLVNYGSLDTWLTWVASNGNFNGMVPTQASRTLLFDPVEQQWSRDLMQEFDIPPALFPDIVDEFPDAIPADGLWENARIVSLIGDQPAATIGGQPPPYEQTRVTLGTAGFVSEAASPDDCPDRLTLGFTPTKTGQIYQSEGVVLSAGRAVDWLIRVLGINYETFEQWLKPPWPEDIPLWCSSFNGVGAPFWQDREATLDFLNESTSTKQICLGLAASILLRVKDIIDYLPENSQRRLLVDGGLTSIDYLPTIAASIWDLPTARTLTPHLTCRGALIASHWRSNYFSGDPWENLNAEIVIPNSDLPSQRWQNEWKDGLRQWNLTTD